MQIFLRSQVHLLHTADKWLQVASSGRVVAAMPDAGEQEGRAPRDGEQPYKRVKARSRHGSQINAASVAQETVRVCVCGKRIVDVGALKARAADVERRDEGDGTQSIGLYGRWQTEIYRPPACVALSLLRCLDARSLVTRQTSVVGGRVPRNAYGNVYLFLPAMCPIGGTHVDLPGVRQVASQLKIDAPPAQVGWDTAGGRSFPRIVGVVVPSESVDALRAAWLEANRLKAERAAKKRRDGALRNWALLVEVVMQRRRIADTYAQLAVRVSRAIGRASLSDTHTRAVATQPKVQKPTAH